MVRVAGLHDQVDAGIDARGPDGLSPGETLERSPSAYVSSVGVTRAFGPTIRPQLAEQGIRVIDTSAR